ncbi:hypothetical protein KL919_005291 [Ogataea angusta]|nr:hypothetical protein KL919_005291 [Ogataea angusta]
MHAHLQGKAVTHVWARVPELSEAANRERRGGDHGQVSRPGGENGLTGDVDRLRSEVSLGQDCTFVLWSLILKHGVRTPGSRTVSAMPWYSYNVDHGDGTSKDWYGVSSHSGEPP